MRTEDDRPVERGGLAGRHEVRTLAAAGVGRLPGGARLSGGSAGGAAGELRDLSLWSAARPDQLPGSLLPDESESQVSAQVSCGAWSGPIGTPVTAAPAPTARGLLPSRHCTEHEPLPAVPAARVPRQAQPAVKSHTQRRASADVWWTRLRCPRSLLPRTYRQAAMARLVLLLPPATGRTG